MKVASTVLSGGKFGDYFKKLPITIKYATATNVLSLVNDSLTKHGIMSAVESNLIEMRDVTTAKGNTERLATVETVVTLTDEVTNGNKNNFQPSLTCVDCDKTISQKIADYSQSKLGRFLCYDCQQAQRKVE